MAQLPNLSPFLEDDFDDRMIDLSSEHVSETESDEEERTVAVDLEGVEETGKKKKKCRRKRRRAGDRSGRQMALRALEKEKKGRTNEEIVSDACPELPRFAEAIAEARCVLDRFKEDPDSPTTEDEASAMRIYILRKYNISSKVRFCFIFKCLQLVPFSNFLTKFSVNS